MHYFRFLRQLALVPVVSFGIALQAQNLSVPPRIVGEVDNASLTVLKGNVSLKARAEFDQGAAPANTQMTGMHLLLSRSKDQEAALKQYMAQQLDKSSPNYHKWLTPEQLGKQYGPAESDVDKIAAWLRSQGLTLVQISPARTNITFSGTVQQVEQAFHVSIHAFKAGSETFLSNTADPSIPSALAPVVSGVAQLNTIRPKPHSIKAGSARIDPKLGRIVPEKASPAGPRANLTGGSSGSYFLYLVPGDAATIYDTPNSFNANFSSSGASYTGRGVTIGIGGESVIKASTVGNYRSTFLGDSSGDQPTITYCSSNQSDSNVTSISVSCSSSRSSLSNGSDQGAVDEAYLDNEVSGGLAPGATIDYYASSDLMSAVQYAIDNNAVDIMSLSFGECEWFMDSSDNSYYNSLWQQAASQGIVVTVSAGDSGSAGCDDDTTLYAAYGLQVSGMASTPYNIAVGGTDYYSLIDESNFTNYVSTSNSSSTYYRTALKYIPESTWNDSVASDTVSSYEDDTPYTGLLGATNIVGGSGGKSSCSTNGTSYKSDGTTHLGSCTSGYSKPSWQTGTGVPSDGVRDLPDVSLMAGNGQDNAAWAVCTDDKEDNSSGAIITENCSTQSDGNFYVSGVGGTSASAPAFAGMLALVQQATCPSGSSGTSCRLGLDAVKTLYDLANGSNSSSVFHDITVGNNSVYCYSNSTNYQYNSTVAANCEKNSAGYYFLAGYDTTTGYDLATGLGSVDVTQLINYWSTATGSGGATVSASASSSSIDSGSSLSVSVTVSGSSSLGTPTGTVSLSGGGYTSSATTLSSGSATISIPANSLESGSDTLKVTYSGDLNYASSTGTTTVTVTQSTFSLSATSPSSISAGSSTTSTVTVSTSSNYSGTVSLSCSLTGSPSGANSTYSPTCSISPSSVSLSSSSTSATATATVTTSDSSTTSSSIKRNSTAAIAPPADHHGRGGWRGVGSGALLALMLFLGLPARRRSWRAMSSILGIAVLCCGLSSCSSSSSTKTTSTTLSASSTSVTTGSSVTLTASVSPSAATGTVTFYDGSTSLGSSSLSSGSATLKTSFSSAGTHSITASYAGTSGYGASTSSATSIKVSSGTTSGTYTFTVTGSGSASSSSTSTTFTVTVN